MQIQHMYNVQCTMYIYGMYIVCTEASDLKCSVYVYRKTFDVRKWLLFNRMDLKAKA